MITQLLSELKCDLTLPKCLQIVGYLRRMQAFSTAELKLKFLQTRDSWFKEILAGIPKADGSFQSLSFSILLVLNTNIILAHQHLTKTVEVTRVNLFNIFTQYKALFDEDFGRDTNSKENLVFNSWLHEKIDDFLRTLENDLAHINNSLIDISYVLQQSMYFGVSFSRIGLDFRAQLGPIFIRAISKYLNTSVLKTTRQFESDMEHFTLINKDLSTYKRQVKTDEQAEERKSNAPPESLLDFRPLSLYCNGILNIFNELRVCSPVAVVHTFIVALEVSLENVAKSILNFYRSEQQAFGMKEKENFLKLCACFSFELLPYIQHCLVVVFPPTNKSALNIESLTTLRNEKILESIEHLLPSSTKI